MTWTRLPGPGDDGSQSQPIRDTSTPRARFLGRAQSVPAPAFVGNAQFVLVSDSLTVDFTDNSTAPGSSIASWLWDFGDGQTSTSQNPTHVYATAGTYLVSLTVVTAAGSSGVFSDTVTVVEDEIESPIPVANFSGATAGLTITFTDTSTDSDGTIAEWSWLFGEGQPTADFSSSINNLTVTFTDASTDVSPGTISTRAWTFGDGGTSTSTNPVHTYTAAGGYNVTLTVTDNEGNSNTKASLIAVTTGATLGIDFGIHNFWGSSYTAPSAAAGVFTCSQNSDSPNLVNGTPNIVTRINAARVLGHRLFLTMTGGNHSNYTVPRPGGVTTAFPSGTEFDLGPNWVSDRSLVGSKWANRLDLYNTIAIRAAMTTALADRTVLGYDVMDEPQHESWGGIVTKEVMDAMASYSKAIFPTLPAGISTRFNYRPLERWSVIDYVHTQYVFSNGNVVTWRDDALSGAALNGVQVVFSINVLNGGSGFGQTSCPNPPTGGTGLNTGRCKTGSQQLTDWGLALGPYGSALFLWQYDTTYWGVAANQTAFTTIAADLAARPRKSLLRTT